MPLLFLYFQQARTQRLINYFLMNTKINGVNYVSILMRSRQQKKKRGKLPIGIQLNYVLLMLHVKDHIRFNDIQGIVSNNNGSCTCIHYQLMPSIGFQQYVSIALDYSLSNILCILMRMAMASTKSKNVEERIPITCYRRHTLVTSGFKCELNYVRCVCNRFQSQYYVPAIIFEIKTRSALVHTVIALYRMQG